MESKRKRYRAQIEPNLEKNVVQAAVALVENPAIELDYVAFSKESVNRLTFKATPDQRMIAGPVLVPDMNIYRNKKDSEGNIIEEFDVYFTKEDVVNFAKHFFKNSSATATNVEHSATKAPSFIIESWFVRDSANDNSAKWGFSNLPEGTLFQVQFVEDEQFWQDYQKTGKLKGFSIEAYTDLALSQIRTTQTNEKTMISTFKKLAFAEAKTKDGWNIVTKDPNVGLDVNAEVIAVDPADGQTYEITDGDYVLEDGRTVCVTGGVITEVKEAVAAAEDTTTETPAATDVQAAMDAMKAEILDAIQKLTDRVAILETAKPADDTEMKETKEALAKVTETVQKLSKAPGAASITLSTETKVDPLKKVAFETQVDTISKIRESLKK